MPLCQYSPSLPAFPWPGNACPPGSVDVGAALQQVGGALTTPQEQQIGTTIGNAAGAAINSQVQNATSGIGTSITSALANNPILRWMEDSANWKHVALIIAGGVLVLVGLVAFVVEPDIKRV